MRLRRVRAPCVSPGGRVTAFAPVGAQRRHPWLRYLFDLYALVDRSVAEALAEARARGEREACGRGCGVCCRQDIPVTPLELAGLRWYVREALNVAVLASLRARATDSGAGTVCRFLLGGVCAVYPVRPVACRRYIVLGDACREGEDPTETRPHALLRPSRELLNAAYAGTLPYYAALGETTPATADAFAFMVERTTLLASFSGKIIAE